MLNYYGLASLFLYVSSMPDLKIKKRYFIPINMKEWFLRLKEIQQCKFGQSQVRACFISAKEIYFTVSWLLWLWDSSKVKNTILNVCFCNQWRTNTTLCSSVGWHLENELLPLCSVFFKLGALAHLYLLHWRHCTGLAFPLVWLPVKFPKHPESRPLSFG